MKMENQVLQHRELFKYLPHRFPFLLVDRVTDYVLGEEIRGVKNLAPQEPFLVPGGAEYYPPGLVIESIGQLAIVLFNLGDAGDDVTEILLGSVSGVAIHQRIPLGVQLQLEAKVTRILDTGLVFSGTASIDGTPVLSMDSLVAMKQPKAA